MEIHTTARHFELTAGLRRHVEEKLARVERYLDRVPEVRVVMSVEKYRHLAEVNVSGDGLEFLGRGVSEDMYTSVDLAVERLLRQIKRHKDRTRHRRSKLDRRQLQARIDVLQPSLKEEEPPQVTASEHQEIDSLTLAEAVARLEAKGTSCLVFSHPEDSRIQVLYRRSDGQLALVETAEANVHQPPGGEDEEA